jgi:hypothetical protein
MAAPRDQESSLLRRLKTPETPSSSLTDTIGRAETSRFVRTDLLAPQLSGEAVVISVVDSRPVAASAEVVVALLEVAADSAEDLEVAARTGAEADLAEEPQVELQGMMRTLSPTRQTRSQTSRAPAASLEP